MSASGETSFGVLIARLTWMAFGPLALMLATFGIVSIGSGWLTSADIAYFVILGVMVLGRWLEFRSGRAQTADGEPATQAHLRRYAIGVVLIGAVVWVVANLIANYLLAR
jgi:hypothetical protein